MDITKLFMTQNPCYKAGKRITPTGIVVHSTGANNPYLKRYVGPDDGLLGKNQYNNHWNKDTATKCVHAFLGKLQDGTLAIYQTLPWDYRCWGVGSGSKGSYNNSHIQFEICEDGLTNETYYRAAFGLAARLCAYLCELYGIHPANVVGHYEAHAAGYGSNHADPRHWQRRFGDTMDGFRAQVAALLGVEIGTPLERDPPERRDSIRKGARGAMVVEMQGRLLAHGIALPKYGVDGIFGAETEAAVRTFQGLNGLTVDGIVGPKTWAALLKEPDTAPEVVLYTVTVPGLTEVEADALLGAWPGAVKAVG